MKVDHTAKIIGITIAGITLLVLSGCQTSNHASQAQLSGEINKYQYVYGVISWQEAKAKAEAAGGQLACLETAAERDFVTSLRGYTGVIDSSTKYSPSLSTSRQEEPINNRKTIWVGLTDEKTEGTWRWINGARLDNSMLGYLEMGTDLDVRDYGHLMRQGGFFSRETTGEAPRGWQASQYVEGYLIEWEQ